ncbi:MAG: FkbM family methyltransferase [Prevotellaceae bacterium]|nr:FkbM family methyltransferase [Prevotellaceae bacterium]
MIITIYRKYIPEDVRNSIYEAFLGVVLLYLRNPGGSLKATYIYLFRYFLPDTEVNRLYAFMGRHGLMPIPYSFTLNYKKLHVVRYFDTQLELPYAIHSGKRLYFPKSHTNTNKKKLYNYYKSLIIEQDVSSPHRYVRDINRLKGKILLDVGAAEAIFSLDVIEQVNHIYIFECDTVWIEALNATFAPWKDKVTIVRKYVGDSNNEDTVTLDRFFENKDKKNLFLKMDIEGCEQAALRGAFNLLKEASDIDFSICTYHKKNDAVEIVAILASYGFEHEQTDGYMYFEKQFRKAIIRRK